MNKSLIFALLFPVLCAGGWYLYKEHTRRAEPEFHTGERDDRGRLVFFTADGGIWRSLDHDYAMRVFRDNPGDDASPFTIELYTQAEGRIRTARSVADFEKHLVHVPAGQTLYQYNKACGSPPFSDPVVDPAIAAACQRQGLKLEESEFGICTCAGR